MKNLRELAKKALTDELYSNLNEYFDYESYQTDVDDFYFRYDGMNKDSTEFEFYDGNDSYIVCASWYDADLNDNLDFKLKRVEIELVEYDEDGNETRNLFTYKTI